MKTSRKPACSMPAIGERAPDRMLVAVRAIAPVAGRPPNRAETVLATPWATSSQFERLRRPVMPSPTTAASKIERESRRERRDHYVQISVVTDTYNHTTTT